MLQIQLLGDLRLTGESGIVPRLATQKAVSLLGYLVMNAGRNHPREMLAEMLWPQRPGENARRRLHTALWQIRRALKQAGLEPAEYVSASDSAIEWHSPGRELQPRYRLDVAEFDSLATAGNPASLQRAVELYRGDLLDGIYDDWCLEERYRLQERFLQVLGRLAERGLNMANDSRAYAVLARARDLAARTEDEHLPEILYRMGTCIGWLGDWTHALPLLAESQAAGERFGDRWIRGRVLLGTGVGQMFTGHFGASIETYRQAEAEAEANGDQLNLATVLGNLADNYLRLHLPQRSREPLRRAQAIWASAGIVNLTFLQNMGWMYYQLGENATAREWTEKAARLARERNKMPQLAHTLSTFVLRLWRDGADGEWRGQLTHLQTGGRHPFTTLVELEALLEEQAPGLGAPQTSPEAGSDLTAPGGGSSDDAA